jgi:hypothetical protein
LSPLGPRLAQDGVHTRHASVQSTTRYARVSTKLIAETDSPLDKLLGTG